MQQSIIIYEYSKSVSCAQKNLETEATKKTLDDKDSK